MYDIAKETNLIGELFSGKNFILFYVEYLLNYTALLILFKFYVHWLVHAHTIIMFSDPIEYCYVSSIILLVWWIRFKQIKYYITQHRLSTGIVVLFNT